VEAEHIFVLQVVEDPDLIHQFLATTPLYGLDRHILNRLFLASLVDNGELASAHLLIDVIVIHFQLIK
jgi:hypothetical protein